MALETENVEWHLLDKIWVANILYQIKPTN